MALAVCHSPIKSLPGFSVPKIIIKCIVIGTVFFLKIEDIFYSHLTTGVIGTNYEVLYRTGTLSFPFRKQNKNGFFVLLLY